MAQWHSGRELKAQDTDRRATGRHGADAGADNLRIRNAQILLMTVPY